MTPVAPRIVNDASYATMMKHAACESFCVAGVVFW